MLRTYALMRAAVGGASYVAPNLSARLFGFDPDRNPQSAYWARLFGVRDVVLGVAALQMDGAARKQVLQLTAACDAADVATTLMGRRGGYISPLTTALSAGLAVAAGAVALTAAADVD
jgi:hypothetical protein